MSQVAEANISNKHTPPATQDSAGAKQPDALNNVFAMQLALLQSRSVIPRYPLLAHQYFYRNGLGNQVAKPRLPLLNNTTEVQNGTNDMPKSAEAAEEIFANGIYFEAGSALLLEKSKPQLNKIYSFLKRFVCIFKIPRI